MGNKESGGFVGEVAAQGLQNVEWTIPRFSKLPRKREFFAMSPEFDLQGSKFFLSMVINGTTNGSVIFLWRGERSPDTEPKTCSLGVKRPDGSLETIRTETIKETLLNVICYSFLNRTREELERGGWLSNDNLTITCHIEGVQKKSLGTDRRCTCISWETQTAALSSVTDKDESKEAKGVTLLSKNMRDLLTTENDDYDLRIFVKGQEFRAHRCILKARCPVFAMMLKHDSKEKNSGEIHIEDCDPESFDEFLVFVYSGRVKNLTMGKAPGLYYAADKYDFRDLKEQCVHFMETHLSTTSVCDVALLAARHGERELLRTATEYFGKNMKHIFLTVEWQKFMAENPTVANELLIKSSER